MLKDTVTFSNNDDAEEGLKTTHKHLNEHEKLDGRVFGDFSDGSVYIFHRSSFD